MMKKGYIIAPIVKMSNQPTDTSETSDEILHGTEVVIQEKTNNGYLNVKTEYGYVGFVPKWSVYLCNYTDRSIVINSFADVYVSPKVQASILETLPMGSFVKVLSDDTEEKYAYIELVDGRKGFIRKAFVKKYLPCSELTQERELRENILKTAIQYKDTQYRWGGKTHLGIDCSGLCFMSYFINGITIYRDSDIKEPVHKINFMNIKPADLIYFKGHIGMYVGNGQMIHSSDTENAVAITNINISNILYTGSVFK